MAEQHHIGNFESKRWGAIYAIKAAYGPRPNGPLAVLLQDEFGERLGTLSVNMYRPECSQDSRDLPDGCFYVKTWGENEELAAEAQASNLFRPRPDIPQAESGFVASPVWEIVPRSQRKARAQ